MKGGSSEQVSEVIEILKLIDSQLRDQAAVDVVVTNSPVTHGHQPMSCVRLHLPLPLTLAPRACHLVLPLRHRLPPQPPECPTKKLHAF